MEDCEICYKDTKALVKCPYCESKVCNGCAKICTLNWASAPKCWTCSKSFTADTLDSFFNKSFRRGALRKQIIQNLQEQETSLFPETMLILEHEKKGHRHAELLGLIELQNHAFFQNPFASLEQHLEKLRELQDQLVANDYRRNEDIRRSKAVVHQKRSIKCPKEDCLGYIVGSKPKRDDSPQISHACAICDTRVCRDCNETISSTDSQDHVECNAEAKVSWSLIKETTKGCPKCGTPIEKISGCNQMWCTLPNCLTAFDWQTNQIINGPIHNPHYHEWLRDGNRMPMAGANLNCDGPRDLITNEKQVTLCNLYKPQLLVPYLKSQLKGTLGQTERKNLERCMTLMGHAPELPQDFEQLAKTYELFHNWNRMVLEIADPWFAARNVTRPYSPIDHTDLRKKYLLKQISKEEWATKLSSRETIRHKRQRLHAVQIMFQTACADVFQTFYNDTLKSALVSFHDPPIRKELRHDDVLVSGGIAHLHAYVTSLESLRIYYIQQMVRILSDYSDTLVFVPEFSDEGYLHHKNCSVAELQVKYFLK